ncbi:metallophosphoesterase family protein [Pedobacter cryophilus]|uniref:Metallophosphoesterase family protein n=1 Tax=Pedobacter cryophilus TaxID=2571271 RepID=A0A4U1BVT4_9SPHI|nr:metallophosphoesterase family protein [Pedobacter cryophilus]TKB96688.1 metallophosphoesterase family protein [Pedobacter cryophilus]
MAEKLKHLSPLKGKILVFGGVYSNLQALEAIQNLALAEGIAPENIICTGDIVAYCAQPKACLELIKNWKINTIAGNVELNLCEGDNDCGCNFSEGSRCDTFARQWYPYLQQELNQEDLDWMATLPEFLFFEYSGKKVSVLHGSFFNTSEFIFKSIPWNIKHKNFEALKADVILAGHCGIPFADENNGKLWLNAGVIGMPANDGTPKVWYALLNDTNGTFTYEIRSLNYDFETAAVLMKNKPLPQTYAETLKTGIWDNCEILPEIEASLQGKTIDFLGATG